MKTFIAYNPNTKAVIDTMEAEEKPIDWWTTVNASIIVLDIAEVKDKAILLAACQKRRAAEYPPVADFLDAYVKKESGDNSQMIEYVNKCNAIKNKYPKPE